MRLPEVSQQRERNNAVAHHHAAGRYAVDPAVAKLRADVIPVLADTVDSQRLHLHAVVRISEAHWPSRRKNVTNCAIQLQLLRKHKLGSSNGPETVGVLRETRAENAAKLGEVFRKSMQKLVDEFGFVKLVRGKGLLNAVVIEPRKDGRTAWDLCLILARHGLLAKPTHGDIIRFAPPLVMNREQLDECIAIIHDSVKAFA